MELERLEALQLVAWRRAKDGDLAAIDRLLKIMEQRAKYLGLVEEEKSGNQVTNQTAVFIGGDKSDYIQQLQQVRDQVEQAKNGQ
jgi:hypothetical protein